MNPLQTKGATEKLIDAITLLSEAVVKLNEKLIDIPVQTISPKESVVVVPGVPITATLENLYPMPSEYREAVDAILNKEFGIAIYPLSDSPSFQFSIIVPDKYSQVSEEYKKMYKADIRAKVIRYSEGLIGVKMWCEMVYNHFNPTMQAQIVADRMK